jgi:hypothetical protein
LVAVWVEEVQARAGKCVDAGRYEGAACGLLVVDDEAEVAEAVGRLWAALHEREELVADVDERGSPRLSAEVEFE